MLDEEQVAKDVFAEMIRSIVDQEVSEKYANGEQEHHIAASVASALQHATTHRQCFDHQITIQTYNVPDKARGSLEWYLGADIYVVVTIPGEFSKGFLVQAKMDGGVGSRRDKDHLAQQAAKMLKESTESYVWSFGKNGVQSASAEAVVADNGEFPFGECENLKEHFDSVFACTKGAHTLGLSGPDLKKALRARIMELHAKFGISIRIKRRGQLKSS